MKTDYVISCCSTADLTEEHLKIAGIEYIKFHYELNGKQFDDDLGKSMSFDSFYEQLKNGAEAKTSQVNADEYEVYFEKFLKQGKDVFHVCLSSGISGAINSAYVAKKNMEKKYPDRKIYIVDSLAASSGFGLLMDKLSELRASGLSADELYAWVEKNKLNLHHWFFSTDLSFYVKGGRISKVSGFLGGILGICPLLNMDDKGHLVPRKKYIGKNKVIRAIVDHMEAHAENGLNYSGKCYISHSASIQEAKKVAELVEMRFPKLNGKVEINNVGTTIGSHTGPGTIALFFWGDKRVN